MAIFTAIGAAVGSFFAGITLKAVAAFALKTVASMGLSMLAQKLAGKKSQQASFSVQGQLGRGADISQSFIVGEFATAGSLVYSNTWSWPNKPNVNFTMVIALSDIPVKGLKGIWVNGRKVTYTEGLDHGAEMPGMWLRISEFMKGQDEYMLARFYDGTQTTADPFLTDFVSSTGRPWDANAVGKGRAYIILQMYLEEGLFANGFPTFLFEVEGIPLYNPALDTTVGGAGAQRWADKTTWQPSNNPAVQLYNVLRGIEYNGEWFYGLQDVSEAQLPVDHWIGQINKCTTTVTGAGGPEAQFRASGEIPVGAAIVGVIESLLTSMNGRLSDAGGVYKLYAGAPDAPVMSFTDLDILSTEGQSFTPFLGLSDTVNGVSGKFPYPDACWQVETAPPLYSPDFEAEDGGRRLLVDVNLDFVPYPEQVQRLMMAALKEARRARRHTLSMPPKFWPLEAGDIVSWTSERNGYVNKQFRVDGVIDLADADVVLDLTEVDPSDYAFVSSEDYSAPSTPGSSIEPIPVQVVEGFTLTSASIPDAAGVARRPALKVTWHVVEDVNAIAFEVRVKLTGRMLAPQQTDLIGLGEMYISDGILPATAYEVRAKFIPAWARPVEWTEWLSTTTPNLLIGVGDLDPTLVPDTTPPAVPTGFTHGTTTIPNNQTLLAATWTPPADADLEGYEVRVKVGTGSFVTKAVYSPRFEDTMPPGTAYSIQVRAFDTSGNRGPYTTLVNATSTVDTTPPAVPTGLAIINGYQLLWLSWNQNTEVDFHHYEIYESATTTAPAVGALATFSSVNGHMARSGLTNGTTRHYWIRSVDNSGNKSAWSARVQGVTATSAGVNSAALAGLVNASSFASGIAPVEILAALPATGNYIGRQVFLTGDKKLYRHTGTPTNATGFTKAVDGFDLVADSVTAGAIGAGAVNTRQLAAGAATIDKLAVRSSQTVNIDPYYEDASAWIAPNITRVAAPAGGVGPWWLQAASSGTNVTFPNNRTPIDPTKTYLLEGWLARLTPTGNGKSFFTVNFFTANGTPVASGAGWPGIVGGNHYFPSLGTIPTLTPARHTITIGPQGAATIPANAAFISFGFFWNYESTVATTGLVGPIRMTEMAAGEAIIDGTLQARHVTTGEFITKTAQIKDAIITEAKIGALSAAKLTAGTALAGSITVSGRALATVAASDAYIENMGNASHWSNYVGVAPTFVASPDAKVGADVLQSNAYCWAYGNQPVIFDPNKLYRIAAIVRRSGADAGGLLYLGLVGYAEDGITKVNTGGSDTPSNQHYCVATAVTQSTLPLNEWTEFVGYVKGVSAVAPGAVGTLEAPSKMHPNVKKLAPLVILNYTAGTTPMQVDYFRIEVVNEDAAAIVNAGVTNINGGKIVTGSIESEQLAVGSVTSDKIVASWLTVNNRLTATYLDVDTLLTVKPDAGLSYQKGNFNSDVDGLYFGNKSGQFGLAASHKSGGKNRSLKMSSETGMEIMNGLFYCEGSTGSATNWENNTRAKFALPAGTRRVNVDLIGGGGGGAAVGGAGTPIVQGGSGGTTTVKLYDGTTLKGTWTSAGGSSLGPARNGENSAMGDGGLSGHFGGFKGGTYFNPVPPTGYGSGGYGGTWANYPDRYYGNGGAASTVTSFSVDVSAYASPSLEVTIGNGGAGGVTGSGSRLGGAGAKGRVGWSVATGKLWQSDVITLEATTNGSFVSNTTGGSFPALGAGLWTIWADGQLNVASLSMGEGPVMQVWENRQATFIASATPTYVNALSRTIFYRHHSMGSWG